MNKIYKIVWSKIKNTYVVVSEVAKSHSKSGQVRGRVTLAAAVLGVLMATTMPTLGVYAADLTAVRRRSMTRCCMSWKIIEFIMCR